MDSMKFREMALSAFSDIYSFAEFTGRSEELMSGGEIDPELLESYNKAWFEMEIVNALALDEWESDGRPHEWSEKWGVKYRADAEETVKDLLKVLNLQ